MKRLSRDFTRGEKALLLLLALILVGLTYYLVVDRPVRSALESARAEKEALVTERTTLQGQIARMEKMEKELESIRANPGVSQMGSYNNSKAELDFLNDLLAETEEYNVTFTGVTRDGDQAVRHRKLAEQEGRRQDQENCRDGDSEVDGLFVHFREIDDPLYRD